MVGMAVAVNVLSLHWSLEADIILSRACFENMSMASKFQVTNNLSRAPKKIEIVCGEQEFGRHNICATENKISSQNMNEEKKEEFIF